MKLKLSSFRNPKAKNFVLISLELSNIWYINSTELVELTMCIRVIKGQNCVKNNLQSRVLLIYLLARVNIEILGSTGNFSSFW